MSAFSRTASGIANYHKFHGVDFMVFVEGRVEASGDENGDRVVDTYYYEYLLSAASKGRKAKVKCVGNKDAAFEYARRIREGGVARSVVIVDKDLEGLTSSPLQITPVIRTFGYSWENELWSPSTVAAVLIDLTNEADRIFPEVQRNLPRLARRLKYLSVLDVASQLCGGTLLTKRSALCGVAFAYPLITAREVNRLSRKFRASSARGCPVACQFVRECSVIDPREVIQGHFWSHMAMRFTTSLYKKITGDHVPSNALLTQLALSHLRRDAAAAVGADLVARYATELARVGI